MLLPAVLQLLALAAAPAPLPPALWLSRRDSSATATLSSSPAGTPSSINGAINGSVQAAVSPRPLALPLKNSSANVRSAALPSRLPEPYMLEATLPGSRVENGTLTMLWANADAATTPHDWFTLQDLALNDLEITLRDAYMHADPGNSAGGAAGAAGGGSGGGGAGGAAAGSLLGARDPFPSGPGRCGKTDGAGWKNTSDWDACVIAVLNLRRSLPPMGPAGMATVSTFDFTGKRITTFESDEGVYILKFPNAHNNSLMYIRAELVEEAEGALAGVPYHRVLHTATATARLVRSWSPADSSDG